MAEYTVPAFLQKYTLESILQKIFKEMPEDIDKSEGNHPWNMVIGPALVMAELCEYVIPEAIRLFCPEWSYGTFLDELAKSRGITRRAATYATGYITITGAAGTVIPEGSTFATASVNDEPSVDYRTTEYAEIPESGSVTVEIRCAQTGPIGNTSENTIVLVGSRITGITAVTNEEIVSGGTDEESDESVVMRITEYDKSSGDSFIGCVADYKRWAMTVPGVGEATVIPANDTTGLVTIIITDSNGDSANDKLCEEVYNYIMRPDNEAERLAPVNALLSVIPPSNIAIAIKATVELTGDATIEDVKESLRSLVSAYLPEATDDKEVKYSKIYSCLSDAVGVNDHRDLQIGIKSGDSVTYGTSNIPITNRQLPVITEDDMLLTIGNV